MSRLPFMTDFVFLIPHTALAAVGLLTGALAALHI